jgi:hypothetical protein
MAETTDRPQGVGPAPSSPEQGITTPDALGVPETAPETYRPLSLLALAGFGLAVVYAAVVLIGAGVALFGRIPWLMPGWSFLLPLAALVLCWVAATHIRGSEGTLSGLAFTTWGIRLTILVALTYGAYYFATFFAVRGQAIECADRFFEQLKQGHNEQAFMLASGLPTKDVDSAELRNMIESQFNTPGAAPGAVGAFTRFCQAHYVRFIEMDGPNAKIDLRGVSEWEHSKGGYKVVLKYHIATALVDFEMNVETVGRDPKPGEPKGRQWQVTLPRDEGPDPMKRTPLGEKLVDGSMRSAQRFVAGWVDKFNQKQWLEAYLDTLPPSERSRLVKGRSALRFLAVSPMSGVATLGLLDDACRDVLATGRELESRKLILLDPKTFWTGKQQRAEILQRVETTFKSAIGGSPGVSLNLLKAVPMLREIDGRTTVFFDAALNYYEDNSSKLQYTVQGQIAVTAPSSDADRSDWRIESINVESGRTPPEPPRSKSKSLGK